VCMKEIKKDAFSSYLRDLMSRRKRSASQMARDLQISHTTVSRWLSGKDIPSIGSCRKLGEYSGTPIARILSITGHIAETMTQIPAELPEFRVYAQLKYPKELDEDFIIMIEDLIERRREKTHGGDKPKS
jgi:transcriptional regulator with XRE-family HTH domain